MRLPVDSDTLGKVSAIFILTLAKKDLSVLIKWVIKCKGFVQEQRKLSVITKRSIKRMSECITT